MAITLSEAIAKARLSWQCNYTVGDGRWRLKELHNLYQLLLDTRDELVLMLSKAQSTAPTVYEREVAILVQQLHSYISNIQEGAGTHVPDRAGDSTVSLRPVGVSIILSGSGNLCRTLLSPLAASIAAGNVSIVASAGGSDQNDAITLLSRVWKRYLDQNATVFVPAFQVSDVRPANVDLITIYDASPDDYASILSSPKAHFQNTMPGYNLGLITEGNKPWDHVARAISQASSADRMIWSDQLHAVFVREADVSSLQQSLAKDSIRVTTIDLVEGKDSEFDLVLHVEAAKKSNKLPIISVKSIERAIDAIITCSGTIQELAIFGPEAQKIASFTENWVRVNVMSVGTLSGVAKFGTATVAAPVGSYRVLPSFAMFSRQVTTTYPKPVSFFPRTTTEIRATYAKLISPLEPEHSGKRIGFFTQAEYLAKGVAATAGVLSLTGLFFVVRWYIQRRR